jgi:hypothetical protein
MAIPRRTKAERACRPQTLWLWQGRQERASYCRCSWLALLVATACRDKAPCPREGYIFRGFSSHTFDVIGASALTLSLPQHGRFRLWVQQDSKPIRVGHHELSPFHVRDGPSQLPYVLCHICRRLHWPPGGS